MVYILAIIFYGGFMRKRHLSITCFFLMAAMFIACSDDGGVPSRLNTPAWLNGTWSGRYMGTVIEITVNNGEMLMSMGGGEENEENIVELLKEVESIMQDVSFTEASGANSYSFSLSYYDEYNDYYQVTYTFRLTQSDTLTFTIAADGESIKMMLTKVQ